ncbi:MAG: DUF2219 family protein [Puniceicoccaceae bacterium]|nr:MAG: DUF2219 family protein [Puniceicoccaceae bacterium]
MPPPCAGYSTSSIPSTPKKPITPTPRWCTTAVAGRSRSSPVASSRLRTSTSRTNRPATCTQSPATQLSAFGSTSPKAASPSCKASPGTTEPWRARSPGAPSVVGPPTQHRRPQADTPRNRQAWRARSPGAPSVVGPPTQHRRPQADTPRNRPETAACQIYPLPSTNFHMLKFFLPSALCILSLISSLTASDCNSPQPWHISVQWDNDMLTGTDEGYTNGARIAFTRALSPDSEEHNALQNALRRLTGAGADSRIDDFRFPGTGELRFQYGLGLSQLMFTPKDPDALTPPPGERPYAAWSGFEFSLQVSAAESASTATLSIGSTGNPSYGQDLQNWIHKNVSDSPIFQGWDSQAPTQLTLNLHLDHKRRIQFLDATADWPLQFDGFTEWGTSLGNLRTDIYAGTHLRAGWNLPNSHLTPRVQLGSFTETLFHHEPRNGGKLALYGFTGLRGYGVLHDITLDGPLWRDWDESVGSKPWQGEWTFGVAAKYDRMEISLSHSIRSDEFDGQSNRSRYGSVLVRLSGVF